MNALIKGNCFQVNSKQIEKQPKRVHNRGKIAIEPKEPPGLFFSLLILLS